MNFNKFHFNVKRFFIYYYALLNQIICTFAQHCG